jgi:hypothetical protein
MTYQQRLKVTIPYQRPAPPQTASARIRAVYAYGCHVLRELWLAPRGIFGGHVSPETQQRVFTVMEAYRDTTGDERMDSVERRVRNEALLTVDQMELERHPPLDEKGNERWGAAIDRLTQFEDRTRHEFENAKLVAGLKSEPQGSGTEAA